MWCRGVVQLIESEGVRMGSLGLILNFLIPFTYECCCYKQVTRYRVKQFNFSWELKKILPQRWTLMCEYDQKYLSVWIIGHVTLLRFVGVNSNQFLVILIWSNELASIKTISFYISLIFYSEKNQFNPKYKAS